MADNWFKFTKGNKIPSLADLDVISDTLNPTADERTHLQMDANTKKFISNFDLMENVNEIIDEALVGNFDEQITTITDFLTTDRRSPSIIKTAVVRCTFSDVETVTKKITSSLLNAFHIVPISSVATSVNTIIESVSEKKSLIVIEQAESMTSDYIDRLFRLLHWFKSNVSVLVCVSTDVSAFSELCSLRILNTIEAETFDLAMHSFSYSCLLEAIHKWNLPFWCSGSLLASIRTQFFACDQSTAEVKKVLRLAILEHHINYPTWFLHKEEIEEFSSYRNYYWRLIHFICPQSPFEFHEDIQNGTRLTDHKKYKTWKYRFLLREQEINDFCRRLETDMLMLNVLEISERSHVEASIEELRNAIDEHNNKMDTDVHASQSTAPTPKKKITQADWKREMEAKRMLKCNDPLKEAKTNLINVIEGCLSRIVKPWSDFKGSRYVMLSDQDDMIRVNPARDMEMTLAETRNSDYPPIALAYRTMLNRDKWKNIGLSDWGSNFENEMPPKNRKHAVTSFFASLGQLELMGVVKAATEKQKGKVQVLHHPTIEA